MYCIYIYIYMYCIYIYMYCRYIYIYVLCIYICMYMDICTYYTYIYSHSFRDIEPNPLMVERSHMSPWLSW